jgi:glutathione peroxidase
MEDFYDFPVQGLDGGQDILGPLRGQVTLAVNVASKCGYTPQYAGLEELYRELKDQNFTVVGFPCNQFGAQEPGTAAEIQSFCSLTYGVTFPMSAKIDVNGAHRHALYAWFEKFLIDRDGKVISRYPSGTKPTDPTFLQDLADLL